MADRAISGAGCIFRLDGKEVGWAQGVSAQEMIQLTPVNVMGEIDVREHVPVGRTVTLTANLVGIFEKDVKAMGIWPTGDTLEVLAFPALVGTLIDGQTGKTIYRITGVRAQAQSWNVAKGTLLMKNVSFQCIRMFHEQDA